MADKKPNEKTAKTEKHVQTEKDGVKQLENVEPTDNSQAERKEVSADAPVTNPETGDNTPVDFKIANNEVKTPQQVERETQEDLQENLNRTSDDK